MSETINSSPVDLAKPEGGRQGFSPANLLKTYWWFPSSYCIPYLFGYLVFRGDNAEETLIRCNKAGLIGFVCALLIFAIWRLDCRFGAQQWLKNSNDTQSKVLIYIFGFVLWLSWFSAGIIIGMTNDQVFELAPQLPGLQNPL
jgi:hypothetical protein